MGIMKAKIITLTILLLTLFEVSGQTCGTPSNSNNYDFLNLYSKNYDNSSICINVSFHIVRNSNSSGGFNPNNIDAIVNNLNSVYNPYNIFINKKSVDYINNSTYFNLNSSEFNSLITLNNVPTSVNFYLVNSAPYAGRAENILSTNLVTMNNYALSPTSAHELGHCLNLFHTHHGLGCNDIGGCSENINRSNCNSCGDFVCDTPADPCVLGQVNSNCDYTGGGYNPDPTNIMSYGANCRNHFTNGQSDRMKSALLNSSLLQQVVSNNCTVAELSSIDNLCFSNDKTLIINNLGSNTTSWQVSSNINIISSTNNSITIRALNPNSYGKGWVKAILSNGTILRKEFKVGVPESTLMEFNESIYYNFQNQRWNILGINYKGLIMIDNMELTWEWRVPNSSIRHTSPYQSYINFRPNVTRNKYIYIRARASNKCGCSKWKGQWFKIIGGHRPPCKGCNNNIIEY